MGNVAIIIGVNVILRRTVAPNVTANAIMIGVPVMITTFHERCNNVIINTVRNREMGIMLSKSKYIASETSSKILESPV